MPTDRIPPVAGYATSDWAGDSARRWARHADRLEAQLEPIADVLFTAAALTPGQRVLDVGCGRGATTRRAAAAVAPSGVAVGVDVADNLVSEARDFAEGTPNVDWVVADAQRHVFAGDPFDAVISRFGVMFFDDPPVAFANLRAAVRTGGTLAMAVWQSRERSPLFEVPLAIGRQAARAAGLSVDETIVPPDGGPFSFGDGPYVDALLAAAGWHDIERREHTVAVYAGGPGTVDEAADVSLEVGPLRLTLEGASPSQAAAVRRGLAEGLEPYHDGTGVRLDAAIVILRARA